MASLVTQLSWPIAFSKSDSWERSLAWTHFTLSSASQIWSLRAATAGESRDLGGRAGAAWDVGRGRWKKLHPAHREEGWTHVR